MKKFTISFLILFTSLLSAQVMQNEEPAAFVPTESKFLSDQIIVQGLYIRTLGNFNEVWSSATGAYINYGMYFPDHNTLNFYNINNHDTLYLYYRSKKNTSNES